MDNLQEVLEALGRPVLPLWRTIKDALEEIVAFDHSQRWSAADVALIQQNLASAKQSPKAQIPANEATTLRATVGRLYAACTSRLPFYLPFPALLVVANCVA